MAGGQSITVSQGTATPSSDVAASGQAITASQGTVTASIGATEALSGSESTSGAGSTASASLVGLKSRKVGGGAASRSLTGADSPVSAGTTAKAVAVLLGGTGISSSVGAFGGPRSVALLGSSADLSQGTATVAGSSTGTQITTFSVEGSGSQVVTFGHVFAQGEIDSTLRPIITSTADAVLSGQQCDVLATWADGSMRHVALTATVTGGTSYKIRSGSPLGGSNLTTTGLLAAVAGDIATITLTGGVTGTASLRDLISSATNRAPGGLKTVEQGPAMLGIEVSQDFSTHVRATFHLRWYGGSTLWCDFILENGYGNLNAQADKSYTCVLDLNGTAVLNTGAITHYNHTSWHRSAWSTGGTLYVKHNVTHLRDTVKAVPYYDPSAAPSSAFLNTLPTTKPAPMQRVANYPRGDGFAGTWTQPWNETPGDSIEATGYQETIGILPRWDALYVVSAGDSRAFNSMLALHDACTVAPVTFLSSTDGEAMRVSDYPSASITTETGFGTGAFTSANPVGPNRTGWIASHPPSVGFLPYLLTAQRSYLRMMSAWAGEHAIWAPSDRNGTQSGATVRQFSHIQLRGWGWTYRMVAQCAWALPDGHASKAYFNNMLTYNFNADYAEYVSPGTSLAAYGGGTIGFLYGYDWDNGTNYSRFMHAFISQALSYTTLDLGLGGANGLAFAKYVGKFIAGLLGNTGEFPPEFGPGYACQPGPSAGVYYTTWAQFRSNTGNLPAAVVSLDSGTTQMAAQAQANGINNTGVLLEPAADMGSPTHYWANFLPAVSYLERLGIDGGWGCWYKTTVAGVPRRAGITFDTIPQFGVYKRPTVLPAWVSALPMLRWYRIPNTALSSVNPPSGYTYNPVGKVEAWTGYVLKTKGSDYIVPAQGGHNDYSGNETVGIILNTTTPVWRTINAITPQGQQTDNAARYADGKPSSRHGYYNQTFIDGLDSVLLHGCSYAFTAGSASQFDAVDRLSMATGDWSQVSSPAAGVGSVKAMGKSWATELVYYLTPYYASGGGSAFRVYRPVANTTTTLNASPTAAEDYRSMAIDPKRGVALVGPGTGGQSSLWTSYNISTGAQTDRTAAVGLSGSSVGLDYDPDGDRYLRFNSGVIHSINPTTFAATALTMTGTPPGNTTTGVYGKFRYVPELKGVVMVDAIGNNVAFARVGTTTSDPRPSFYTDFSTTENPLSQSGRFYKTIDWWENVRTASGRAYGLNGPDNEFDDAFTIITGATGDYELIGTIYRDAALNTGVTHEIELNFNFKEVNGGVRGFECLFAFFGSTQAFIWNHGDNGATNFVEVSSSAGAGGFGAFATGNQIRATKIGNTLRAYARANSGAAWTLLATYTNSTFTDGEAAIAFFTRPGGNSAHFALEDLTVTPL